MSQLTDSLGIVVIDSCDPLPRQLLQMVSRLSTRSLAKTIFFFK